MQAKKFSIPDIQNRCQKPSLQELQQLQYNDDDKIITENKTSKTQYNEIKIIPVRQIKKLNSSKTGQNLNIFNKDIKKEILQKSGSLKKFESLALNNQEENQEENPQGQNIVLAQIFPNYLEPLDKKSYKTVPSNKTTSDKFLTNRKIIKDQIRPNYLKEIEINNIDQEEFDIIGNCVKIVQNQQRKNEKNWEKPDENDIIRQKVSEKYSSLQNIQQLLAQQDNEEEDEEEGEGDEIDEENDYLYQYYALQQQKQMEQIKQNQITEQQEEEDELSDDIQQEDVENIRVKTSQSKLSRKLNRKHQQLKTLQSTVTTPIYTQTPTINQKKNTFNRVTFYRACSESKFILHSQQKHILNNIGVVNTVAPSMKNIVNKTVMCSASISEIKKKFDHLQIQKDADEAQQIIKQRQEERKMNQKKDIGIYGIGATSSINFGLQQYPIQQEKKQQLIQQITQLKKDDLKTEMYNTVVDYMSQINEQNSMQEEIPSPLNQVLNPIKYPNTKKMNIIKKQFN